MVTQAARTKDVAATIVGIDFPFAGGWQAVRIVHMTVETTLAKEPTRPVVEVAVPDAPCWRNFAVMASWTVGIAATAGDHGAVVIVIVPVGQRRTNDDERASAKDQTTKFTVIKCTGGRGGHTGYCDGRGEYGSDQFLCHVRVLSGTFTARCVGHGVLQMSMIWAGRGKLCNNGPMLLDIIGF